MRRIRLLAAGAGCAVFGLVLLALSGVIDVAASVRPFAATQWLWHIAVRQSVTLRSLGIEAPGLDDPAMIGRAAGHYDLVCAGCHGSPASGPAEFARHLLPRPPGLVRQMDHWRPPARLFWTVKHGIRHSAMPAWPDPLRDDEVWDMVALLRALPDLDPDAYAALAGRGSADLCARCHGADGAGRGGGLPRLDVQSPAYLAEALAAFRDGGRASGIMRSVAVGLDDAAIAGLSQRLGRKVALPPGSGPGAVIARRGVPDRKVPACEGCHGPSARPDYPRLAGQDADYIARQLRLFVGLGAGRGGRHAEIMARAAAGLTEADIAAVSAWYAGRSADDAVAVAE